MNKTENSQYNIIESSWKIIEEEYEKCHQKYSELIFHSEKFDEFKQLFINQYNDIMKRFMKEDTTALDPHKQAAILTISCLKANIIEHKLEDSDKISIIPQMIAVNIGLSYMKDSMNKILKEKKSKKKIKQYYLPIAIACETPYSEIICRILYHEQNEPDMSFNILELSDRYFLLEYINLLQRGIEPHLLK